MGLGKSKQALDACAQLSLTRILAIAPKTLTYNWAAEIEKWYPDWNVWVLDDNPNKRRTDWIEWDEEQTGDCPQPCVMISNYEKVSLSDWPMDIRWDVVIPDECQALKNTSIKRHKAVKQLKTDRLWGLSGTPMELRVEELFGIMSLIRPAVFGSWLRFRDQHVMTDAFGNTVGPRNLDLLKERIAPWVTRRKKEDVLAQLPPKLYNTLFIDMPPDEAKEYTHIKKEFLKWLEENEYNPNNATTMTQMLRLQQFTCSPNLLDEEVGQAGAKFDALEDLIKEWDGQIMVFTRFSQMAYRLLSWLGLPSSAIIAGEVPAKGRVSVVTAFNAGQLGKTLVSTDAGAYGLNVTGANLVIHYDQLWNPGKMWQREDRLHRIGQKDTVNVLNMITRDTIDEGMVNVLEKRRGLFKEVIDGSQEVELSEIGTGTLRRIVEGKI